MFKVRYSFRKILTQIAQNLQSISTVNTYWTLDRSLNLSLSCLIYKKGPFCLKQSSKHQWNDVYVKVYYKVKNTVYKYDTSENYALGEYFLRNIVILTLKMKVPIKWFNSKESVQPIGPPRYTVLCTMQWLYGWYQTSQSFKNLQVTGLSREILI